MAKDDTITDVEKASPKQTPPYFRHKVDYEVDTNENNRGSDDSPSETYYCVRELDKEYENEDDDEFKERLLWWVILMNQKLVKIKKKKPL